MQVGRDTDESDQLVAEAVDTLSARARATDTPATSLAAPRFTQTSPTVRVTMNANPLTSGTPTLPKDCAIDELDETFHELCIVDRSTAWRAYTATMTITTFGRGIVIG